MKIDLTNKTQEEIVQMLDKLGFAYPFLKYF